MTTKDYCKLKPLLLQLFPHKANPIKLNLNSLLCIKYVTRQTCLFTNNKNYAIDKLQTCKALLRVTNIFNRVKYDLLSYSVFQGFSLAKFAYSGSILSSSQFLIEPQLPQKMKLTSKVVKIDPKIIVSLPTI